MTEKPKPWQSKNTHLATSHPIGRHQRFVGRLHAGTTVAITPANRSASPEYPIWAADTTSVALTISSSESGGSSSSAENASTALPDLYTGAMSYQIPIEVPAGRSGIDTGIALKYRSNNGNGGVGVGWELEIGSIQRSVKNGVNYSGDSYQFKTDSSQLDLVNVGNNEYLAMIESQFSRIRKLTAADGLPYWEVTNKSGIRFLFGQSVASRQDDPANTTRIYKWCLDRIEDPNGNYITATYSKDRGEIYLNRIDYTNNGAPFPYYQQPTNYVLFYRELRYDAPISYTVNFGVTTAYRLKTIDVFANSRRFRKYNLDYDADNNTSGVQYSSHSNRSLLTKITQYASDGTTTLPPVTFGYNGGTPAFNFQLNGPPLSNASGYALPENYSTIQMADINGDGKSDLCVRSSDGMHCWLSDGYGFPTHIVGPPLTNAKGYTDVKYYSTIQLADINGDGKADICARAVGGVDCWLSDGNGFPTYIVGPPLSDKDGYANPIFYTTIRMADVNGDGKADMCVRAANGVHCWLSDGGGFPTHIVGPAWTDASGYSNPKYYSTIRMADINGDGKSDICIRAADGVHCWLSDGAGFPTHIVGPAWSDANGYADPMYYSTIRMADINGDGKADICMRTAAGMECWLSDGSGFPTRVIGPSWSNANGYAASMFYSTIQAADVNGDGKADLCVRAADGIHCWLSDGATFPTHIIGPAWSNAGGYAAIEINSTIRMADFRGDGKAGICIRAADGVHCYMENANGPDLLSVISNGLGGTTNIQYLPSTAYQNLQLPFPVQTVNSITTSDGKNDSLTTNYSYTGGFFHIGERDFRGFNYAKETTISLNNPLKISETWFHQGIDIDVIPESTSQNELKILANVQTGYMKGKPYRTRISDASGKKYAETTMNYAPDTNGAPYFNPPYQVDTYTYDGDISYTQAQTNYTYGEYGNVIREEQRGNVNDPNDDRTVVRTFSPNTSNWIVGLPSSEDVYKGIGTLAEDKVAGKVFYYDDLTACNGTPTNNQTPVYGKLTRVVLWLSDGISPEARMAYNSIGKLICQSDAKGTYNTIEFDSTYTFPLVINTLLGRQIVNEYYGVNGVPADKGLYGQIKSIKDINNATPVMEYDVFGRKTKTTLPDGTWTNLTYNSFGIVGNQNVRTDRSDGLWKTSYFDGFGRNIKEVTSGPDQKQIVRDTSYTAIGTIKQASLPYFNNLETPRYITYTYDPLGRVIKQSNPDATFNLACYNDGATVKIDSNGHQRREVRDVLGRLVKVQEYKGSFNTCSSDEGTPYATTLYTYDVLGNLRFVSDVKGNQSEMRYDTLGRKYYMSDPDMGVWSYGYDVNSNLTAQTDAKGQTITFVYDKLNRLTTKHYPTGKDTVFTYDSYDSNNIGRLSSMTDAAGKIVYNYDNMGRIIGSARTIDGVSYPLSFSYVQGRLNSVTYPDNETVTYSYDNGGNLTSAGSYATYSAYNALAQPGSLTFGNGVLTTYQYYPSNNRLKSIISAKGATNLLNFTYIYDNVGNLKNINDGSNNPLQSFNYDDLNRLSSAGSTAYGALLFGYDEIGNILTKEGVNYTYGGPRPHAVTSLSNGKTYSYDANGNIVSDGQRTISYNYDNMPTQVGAVNFTYDGNGARIKKYITSPSIIYIDKYYECISGACTKYIFAGENRVASKASGQVSYYHTDHLGSTNIVTNSLGIKTEDISYLPFGKTNQDIGSNLSHKYTGQELDSETGLYNYNARLYDPTLGRFLTPDTIVPDPKNPQALNRYSYVLNNPLSYTDPTGHSWWSHFWNSLIEALTHPEGEVNVNVSINSNGATTTNTSPGPVTGPSTGPSANNTGGGPSVSINVSTAGTNGYTYPGMNINVYSNGSWVTADSLNLQLLNSFQKSDGSRSGGSARNVSLSYAYYNGDSGNMTETNTSSAPHIDWQNITELGINALGYGVGVAALATESPLILTAAFGFTAYSAYTTYKDYKLGEISTSHAYANGVSVALNVAGVALAKSPYMQAKLLGIGLGGLGRTIDTMNFGYSFLPK